jgi:hypothetical protein
MVSQKQRYEGWEQTISSCSNGFLSQKSLGDYFSATSVPTLAIVRVNLAFYFIFNSPNSLIRTWIDVLYTMIISYISTTVLLYMQISKSW